MAGVTCAQCTGVQPHPAPEATHTPQVDIHHIRLCIVMHIQRTVVLCKLFIKILNTSTPTHLRLRRQINVLNKTILKLSS